jgi:DNA gyrase subunit A
VRNLEEEGRFIFATRNGTVKKTELKDFSNNVAVLSPSVLMG